MPLAPLLALALAAADPQTAASAGQAPASAEAFPIGAPTDDYGLVSWCYGALSGHMDLYKLVKPDLDKISTNPKEDAALDKEQLQAGQEYLALYKKAMEAAEKATEQPINVRGGQAVKAGANIWNPALQADPKTRMWSYLSWDLPGRCETTAERLYEKSLLAAQVLGVTIDDSPAKPAAATATVVPTSRAPTTASPAGSSAPASLRGRE